MTVDWQKLAKDPKAWAAVAGTVALGAFAYTKRQKNAAPGAGQPGASTGAAAGAYNGAGYATADTTGTDLASFLGSYSQSLQQQLAAGLQQFQQQGASTLPTTGRDVGGTPYLLQGTHIFEPVKKGWNISDWVGSLNSGLGAPGAVGTTQAQILALNPNLASMAPNGIFNGDYIVQVT